MEKLDIPGLEGNFRPLSWMPVLGPQSVFLGKVALERYREERPWERPALPAPHNTQPPSLGTKLNASGRER